MVINFCTSHDSIAVVTCTKFYSHNYSMISFRISNNDIEFWCKIFSEMAPRMDYEVDMYGDVHHGKVHFKGRHHDEEIPWKTLQYYWPFVLGIHGSNNWQALGIYLFSPFIIIWVVSRYIWEGWLSAKKGIGGGIIFMKIRWFHYLLILIMRIPISGKTVFILKQDVHPSNRTGGVNHVIYVGSAIFCPMMNVWVPEHIKYTWQSCQLIGLPQAYDDNRVINLLP